MAKTKFKVDILKRGSNNDEVLKLIASHNEGQAILSIPDFISYAITRAALFPFNHGDFEISRDEDDSTTFHVSEDKGKTFTLTIQEVEILELVEANNPDDIKHVL